MSSPQDRIKAAAALWSLGDYDQIAPYLEPVAETTVDACIIHSGERVLDVAAGTGNAALAAARRGAEVTALELTDALRERGARRSAAAGAPVAWAAGNVEQLPFEDGAFDVVVSVLGVMFAAVPQRAADELLRVVRPGGRIAIAGWRRDGASGALTGALMDYMSAPPGISDPHDWGDPDRIAGWLGDGVEQLRCELRTVSWQVPAAEDLVVLLEEHAAAFVAARTHLGPERWAAARADLLAVIDDRGHATTDGFTLDWDYLLVTARRR